MALHLPTSIGSADAVMSVVVLPLWIPLRELPGLGSVANALAVGIAVDVTLPFLGATCGPVDCSWWSAWC